MGYQSLYRKYRPATFEEMVGQAVVVEVIRKSIIKEKIAHAYLFTGPRGTGKTSMAKLLAQAVNCEALNGDVCGSCSNCKESTNGNHPDIVEIDAASNNGVDEIRKLIERVKYTPILGKYKVYIIDEVHMLSQGAFNALLKTLEEPPEHVIFILATTEIHKVIPTIISRCQRFDFTHINNEDISMRLNRVLKLEDIEAQEGVTEAIAKLSGGGLRNALTILEQAIVYSDDAIKLSDIYDLTGMLSSEEKIKLFSFVINNDMEGYIEKVADIRKTAHNLELLSLNIANSIKDSIVLNKTNNIKSIAIDDRAFVEYLETTFKVPMRYKVIDVILEYVEKMKFTQNQGSYFELMMLQVFNSNDTNHQREAVNSSNEQIVPRETTNATAKVTKSNSDDSKILEKDNNIVPRETSNNAIIKTEDKKVAEEKLTAIKKPLPKEEVIHKLLTDEVLVQFMVAGNKELRLEDEKAIENFDIHLNDIKWARSYRLVNEAELVLSSESFVVFSFDEDYQASESLNKIGNRELREFMEFNTGKKRHVFSTTKSHFMNAVKTFLEMSKNNTLPEPVEITYSEDEAENQDEILLKASLLFGDKLKVE